MQPTLGRLDDWPRTGRLLPWLIALFLAMVFLVPIEAFRLPIPLPVDSTPDRFLLPVIVVVWLCGLLTTRGAVQRLPRTWIPYAIGFFAIVAGLSIAMNAGVLQTSGDLPFGTKALAIFLSYCIFFFVAATTIRPTELRNFGTLIVALACLTAVGVIVESQTGFNVFQELSRKLEFAGVSITEPAGKVAPELSGRPDIIGPAQHGLAVCTMMAFALPIAIERTLDPRNKQKILWIAAEILMLAAGIATFRKTAVVLPIAVVVVFFFYRPRQMLRIFPPIALVLLACVLVIAPKAAEDVGKELTPNQLVSSDSVKNRLSDYGAVRPDILAHPVLGRGFGTYTAQKYRYIDNEYLGRLIETGAVGAAAYVLMILTVMFTAHATIRRRDPTRSGVALAASAGVFAYGVAGFLFDDLGFVQCPYLFFFAAAMIVVARTPKRSSLDDRLPDFATPEEFLAAHDRSLTSAVH